MNKYYLFGALGLILASILVLLWKPTAELPLSPPTSDKPATTTLSLRFGHNVPPDSAMHQAALRFAKEVARESAGRVKVTVFPAQHLGNDHEMVEMARNGELDIILTPTAKMSVPVPAMQYADLPFLFPTREDAYDMLDGEPGQMLLDKLEAIGLIGVTFWENGFKQFTGNQPLRNPADFQGLKIRVMKSRMLMEQFEALGAHPIPIDFYATRKALADGVVDGEENPLIAIVSMGFHEVQSDLTLSNHGYLCYVFSISKKVFDRLPPEIQQILLTTAKELATWEREETQRREGKLLQIVREAGVTIHQLDDASRKQFEQKTAYIADQYEAVIGAGIMSKTQQLLYEKYATNSENKPIVIGLDTDLSMDARISGLAIKRGAIMAVNEINKQGGLLGRHLRLIARDHQGIPTQGIKNIKAFASDPNVVAVIGGQHGSVVNSELDLVHQQGIPFLLPWAAVAKAVDNGYLPNFVYRVSANDRLAAPYIIQQAIKNHRRPAIFYQNSVWGRGNLSYMRDYLKAEGLQFVYEEMINRGAVVDFTQLLEAAKVKGADVIVMVLKPKEGGELIDAMSTQNKPLPLVAHWGIVGGTTWQVHSEAIAKLNLSVFQTFSFINNERPQAKELAQSFIRHFGLDSARQIEAPAAVAQSYDLVQLLALAIKQAGTAERLAVRDALEQLPPHNGVVRFYPLPFSTEHHDALGIESYQMTRFARDGALEPIHKAQKD
jgi:C4-dicarboxylate-binding protein DctP